MIPRVSYLLYGHTLGPLPCILPYPGSPTSYTAIPEVSYLIYCLTLGLQPSILPKPGSPPSYYAISWGPYIICDPLLFLGRIRLDIAERVTYTAIPLVSYLIYCHTMGPLPSVLLYCMYKLLRIIQTCSSCYLNNYVLTYFL